MEIEKIQYYAQKSDYDCGIAVAGMELLSNGDSDFDFSLVEAELQTTETWGTDPDMLLKFFRVRKFYARLITNSTSKQIHDLLNNGFDCIGIYQNCMNSSQIGQVNCGHYGIITSVTNGTVRIVDPDSDTGQYNLSIDHLMDRMIDVDRFGGVIRGGVIAVKKSVEIQN